MRVKKENGIGIDAARLTIVKILTTLLTMIIAMLLSRYRTLEEYGTYSEMQLVGNLIATIFMIGLPNSISYFISRFEEKRKRFLDVYFSLSTILGLVAGILMILIIPLIVNYFNNETIKEFWYFLFFYPWTKITLSSIENLLIVYGRVNRLVVFKIIYSSITLLVLCVTCGLNYSFEIYMVAFTSTEVIFAIWVYIIYNSLQGRRVFIIDKAIIVDIIRFSLPIGLSSVVATISIEIDKLLIGYFYTTEELAIYNNASKEIPIAIISSSISAILMPVLVKLMSQQKIEKAVELWKESILLSYIFIAFSVVILIVYAPEIITLLYSAKYLPGVNVFIVYALAIICRVTYFGILLNASGNTKFVLYSSLASLVLNFILNIVFYYCFGYIGPAIATVCSTGVVAFAQIMYTAKVFHLKVRNIFPWLGLLKISVVNGIFFTIMKAIDYLITMQGNSSSCLYAVCASLLFGIIYLFIYRNKIKQKWQILNSFRI